MYTLHKPLEGEFESVDTIEEVAEKVGLTAPDLKYVTQKLGLPPWNLGTRTLNEVKVETKPS